MTVRKKILVDLTPVLPGGLNGGAKVFVLELLKKLIFLKPDYLWVLILRPGVKKELSFLKKSNVKFYSEQNLGLSIKNNWIKEIGRKIIKHNPFLPLAIISIGVKISSFFLKKYQLRKVNLDGYHLLFCPFTAPIYHKENIPTVSIVYDLQYKTFPNFFSNQDIVCRNASFENACEKADKLIAISDYTKNKIIEYGKVDTDKLKTIHISLANRFDNNKKNDFLTKSNLNVGKYIIYPANFWKHKNHEFLLTAFQVARSQGMAKDIKLVLTGAPCERQESLKNIVKKLGLDSDILFLDYVSENDLAELIKNSIFLIFPSLYEGFGIPIIEAMMLGVPVLCSNVTSLPEIGHDAVLMFNPYDPFDIVKNMLALINNKSLRDDLIKKGRLRSEKFSDINQMALDYLNQFNEVML